MIILTTQQRKALLKVYRRNSNKHASFLAFRRTVQPALGYIMVKWCGMWLGIEPDGYTHS